MQSLDDMPVNDVIALYYEKQAVLKQGDLNKLLALKSKHPALFDKEKEAQIRDMIDYAKAFQASDRYKELRQLAVREKLSVIKNDLFDK